MTGKEIEALVAEDERRLGVGSREFRQQHNEIMAELNEIENKNKADAWEREE